jgi:hypothetical protein
MVIITRKARSAMLNDIYLHEMLARAKANPGKHEIAHQQLLAELPLQPGLLQRAAHRSGRVLISVGSWLMAHGAELQPTNAPTSFSHH